MARRASTAPWVGSQSVSVYSGPGRDRPNPQEPPAALSGLPASRIGAFRYDMTADHWWWSDELYRIFGFEPGQIVPTTALIRTHLHPDDLRPNSGAALSAGSIASVHRIVDARRGERAVAVIATVEHDDNGPSLVEGYVADVTDAIRALASTEATRQIHDPDDQRALVEQAVGIITAMTGRHHDSALALLRTASTRRHVAPGEFARRVIAAAIAAGRLAETPTPDRGDPLTTLLAMKRPHQPPPDPRTPPPQESDTT